MASFHFDAWHQKGAIETHTCFQQSFFGSYERDKQHHGYFRLDDLLGMMTNTKK